MAATGSLARERAGTTACLRPQRGAEARIRAAIRRRFALTYDLGEQDDEGRTIHRHFVVGIDHAGMAAAWPEFLVDDMGSTIEYHGLLGKSRRAAERALEPHDLAHAIEAAKRLSDLRNGIERAQTERLIALLDRQFRADLAFELQIARDPRQLPRRHQQIAGDDGRRIVTDRRGGGGQFNTECM